MDATMMTTEASNTQLTKSRRGPPAYRKPNQTRDGRLRQAMIADYIAKLGGRVGPIQLADIERVVDLDMLAKTARADLAAGKTTIDDLVKLENATNRALQRLNLPVPKAAAPGDDAWRKFLADHGDG